MTTPLTIQIAEEILPYLIYLAQMRWVTTYGELAGRTGRHPRNFNHPLGYIRDEICEKRGLPLLTALLVDKTTGLPGDGFLPEGRGSLTNEEYAQEFIRYRDAVYDYKGWDALLRELGLQPHEKTPEDLEVEGTAHLEVRGRLKTSGEDEVARQALKRFAADNPFTLPLPSYKPPEWNHRFPSGETCDLVYDLEGLGTAIVQVCYGRRGELVTAIHHLQQCREQMMAEKGYTDVSRVKARVVAFEIPEDIRDFAAARGVNCTAISRNRVMGAV